MKLKDYAAYYRCLKLWVFPYNTDTEMDYWKYWKAMKEGEYEAMYSNFTWSSLTGIKLVLGKKGARVLEVKNRKLLGKALGLLELPGDYPWIIDTRTSYGIIIDTPGTSVQSKGVCNRTYGSVLILWDGSYVLPSEGILRYFYKNRMPKSHPTQVADEVLFECVENLMI